VSNENVSPGNVHSTKVPRRSVDQLSSLPPTSMG
jgi:hypothetical protein